ncbi:phage replisome organizer N-terminal domain-containing protein [Clostridium beijerinckii]|uniref:Phage replisome organizer n=1 Tax=Clostridium beijerinckii TaxID=1520 RepID=A0AAW3W425_CLOBE|nr:phage replisome organizer N-terminal domain-containing protein [Clostridium beijerinckii]MBC2456104.1 phage replisome organizer [Clostridium beijerinckii]MBC2473651.1 phage replisome organizer [Clostridium beijerinckii]NOV62992.1 putative phage replisome organizer [Clostridium beijerinckii]NOV70046.1 putative phage replisome organizer [Clostridium beijerinckii]NOW31047.1 putative phage replisome organizer [Clostridium beijerinckii]
MRERKYVKFRVDMYDDTKSKMIDRRPERDLIHYVWTRVVTLAGKVNREGDLFMSKSIPYTIETLAIEFNRDIDQVKLALEVLMELEMVELSEHNVYRVKNFAKHQNIKVKEKVKINYKEDLAKIENKDIKKEDKKEEYLKNESRAKVSKDIQSEKEISQNENEDMKSDELVNQEMEHKDINKAEDDMTKEKTSSSLQDKAPILLKVKRNKSRKKEKKDNSIIVMTEEENIEHQIDGVFEGERPLGEGERIISSWTFVDGCICSDSN